MKTIIIRKFKDKVEIRNKLGELILDIIVAHSSKTKSVNLSFKANDSISINRVTQNSRQQA